MNIFMLAQAQDAAGAAGQEPANMFQQILASPMFMFVIIIVLFWVMLIRPQRKAQKEQQARIAALQRGDKVITNAGLHGFVEKVNERTVSLKIAEGVVIEWKRTRSFKWRSKFCGFPYVSCHGPCRPSAGADVYF